MAKRPMDIPDTPAPGGMFVPAAGVEMEAETNGKAVTDAGSTRRQPSPDIQTLAKIDRMLADLAPEVAARTLAFLNDKYSPRPDPHG